MKKLVASIVAVGLLGCLHEAGAATMRLSTDGGLTWTVVDDNGPLDSNPTAGFITYNGPVGDWVVSVASGIGSPAVGSATAPKMDLSTSDLSSQAETLIVQMSDTNYSGFPNQTYTAQIIANTDGTVLYNTYRDSGDVLFGTTSAYAGDPVGISPSPTASPLIIEGPFTAGDYFASNSVMAGSFGTYSLTLETIITHNAAGQLTSTDAKLTATPPPPCQCTLAFISPPAITNCVGDVIPDVVAVQNCANGVSNTVPVTFVGASTNGSCPAIITRTNSAMDACGDIQTFVQTITVNCLGGICGHVFADCDGNGSLSAGDVGIAKIPVSLLDASNHVLATIITDTNGGYCFTNLPGGNYCVTLTPPTGYCQTAGSTSYHWKDSYGRDCWQENDGYIHCLSSGTECWWDKSNTCHWKDSYGRDCWKDNYGTFHCQPLCYQSCNTTVFNNKLCVTLTNCTTKTDVDFAYTGTKPSLSVCVTGPSYVKCGQTCTYTCTVTNTGNVCFTGGTVCHTVGNCNWGWWSGCNTYTYNCPPLGPGQTCTFTQKCTFNSWNCGIVACQSSVNCNNHYGNTQCQSICYSQCGW